MKTTKNAVTLAFFGLFFSHCTLDPKNLDGSWQAFSFEKNGFEQAVKLDEIHFFLDAKAGRYSFSSLFRYQEAGHFRASRSSLFLTDTTARPFLERKIEVKKTDFGELWIETTAGEVLKMRRDSI